MEVQNRQIAFFDDKFGFAERLPREFVISFREVGSDDLPQICVLVDGENQAGDTIDDNAYEGDGYRYHDIFHYTFATMLGWSPCTRAMLKNKRKSDPIIDKIEDGARATITEEAISLMIFNEAKGKNFFRGAKARVNRHTLKTIKAMTSGFEVKNRSMEEWETAILKAYEIFRLLIKNRGGRVSFNMLNKSIIYQA